MAEQDLGTVVPGRDRARRCRRARWRRLSPHGAMMLHGCAPDLYEWERRHREVHRRGRPSSDTRAWRSSPAPTTASARRRPSPSPRRVSTCSSPTCAPTPTGDGRVRPSTRAAAADGVLAADRPICPGGWRAVEVDLRPTASPPRCSTRPSAARPGVDPRQQRQRLGGRHVRSRRPLAAVSAATHRPQPRRRRPRRRRC